MLHFISNLLKTHDIRQLVETSAKNGRQTDPQPQMEESEILIEEPFMFDSKVSFYSIVSPEAYMQFDRREFTPKVAQIRSPPKDLESIA